MASPVSLLVVPHTACVPHIAEFPCVPPAPQIAVLPQMALVPQTAAEPSTNTLLPQTAAALQTPDVPHTAWVADIGVLAFTTVTASVVGSNTATGDAAVPPTGTESVLVSAPQASRYPAPIVKMSYWLL